MMSVRRMAIVAALLLGSSFFSPPAYGQSPPTANKTEPYSFRDVVKKVLPAVVSVEAKVLRNRLESLQPSEGSESTDLKRFFEGLEPRRPQGNRNEMTIGLGSGFVVDAKGIVMTNYHVVENADTVEITFNDGEKVISRDIKGDKKTDLAIVRFEPRKGKKLTALDFADSSAMEVGDRVLAVGSPFGLSGSVTSGIISAKGRDVELNDYDDFLQTDAAINPGNSGGPLVNLDGKVIGVNSAIKSGSGGFQGVSLAISSNMARDVMVPLVRDGIVKRPYIGIRFNRTRPRDLETQSTPGVKVASVVPKAPADKGGILPDDLIVSIESAPIKRDRDLTKAIASHPVGASVNVGLIRDGKPTKVRVVLEEEPKDLNSVQSSRVPSNQVSMVPSAGMQLRNVLDAYGQLFVVIHGVDNGGPADQAGLKPGSVILKIDNRIVENAEMAKTLIEENIEDGVRLRVQVGRQVSTITLQKS